MAKKKVAEKSEAPAKTTGSKRKPSAYNTFMKNNIAKVKGQNPDLDHKAVFKKVAEMWKTSPENVKKKA